MEQAYNVIVSLTRYKLGIEKEEQFEQLYVFTLISFNLLFVICP